MSESDRAKKQGLTTPTPDGTVDEEDRAQLAGVNIPESTAVEPPGEGTSSWTSPPEGMVKFPFF